MSETTVGREPIVVVCIEQPACAHVFGTAPCTATGEACYQTRATCKDAANYLQNAGSVLRLYYGVEGAGRPADELYIMPFLISASTSPAKINLSGADKNANPLGVIGRATIRFRDAPHTDRVVDPYVATRSYDAMAQGTHWSKWNARNRYGKVGAIVRIYQGYAGQLLADMVQRVYICEALDFNGGPTVTMKCADMMVKASDRSAMAPLLSPGHLHAAIDAVQTTIEVAAAVIADYPATGTLRINREAMTYSAVVTNANGRLDFTVTARGSDGTTSDAHSAEDQVQECLRFSATPVDQAIEDLFTDYTTVDAAYLDTVNWAVERATYLSSYSLTGLITKPTPVRELLGEICEQAQLFVWWDERSRLFKLKAVRAITSPPRVITEGAHILAGSFSLKEKHKARVSRVWMYYGQKDTTDSVK